MGGWAGGSDIETDRLHSSVGMVAGVLVHFAFSIFGPFLFQAILDAIFINC